MDNEPSSSTGDKNQLPLKDVEKESSNLPSTSQELDQSSPIQREIKSKYDIHDEDMELDPFEGDLEPLLSGEWILIILLNN